VISSHFNFEINEGFKYCPTPWPILVNLHDTENCELIKPMTIHHLLRSNLSL
jgi:hypothetical protein